MAFDKRTLVLPAGTAFEEHTIVTTGDLILGNRVKLAFGGQTDGRIFAGQGAEVGGSLQAGGDLRLDQSCHVEGDVVAAGAVYLGERCFVKGDLEVEGDLDVGDDVKVSGQLKATGWVNKRNPVPLVIYLFIYLLELLRLGQSEEVDRILKEMEEADDDEIAVGETFLYIPDESEIGLQKSLVRGGLDAGENCRILGNLTVQGDAELGEGTHLFGALRADGDVTLASEVEVQGELVAGGKVVVGHDCQVLGDLKANEVEMFPGATVDGTIVAPGGVVFRTEEKVAAEEVGEQKVEEFESKRADLVDLLG
ncbi:MAG: hypothetical protein ACPGQL_03940 [Thermoplasmatota archaeon]